MKSVYRKSIIFIAIFVIFLAVTQWILWSHAFKGPNYIEYNSIDEYIEKNTNSESKYEIIAQDNKNAVCLVTGVNYTEIKILSNIDEKWVERIASDYKFKSYLNTNLNNDFDFIYIFKIRNNNMNIILVNKVVISWNHDGVYNEEDKKLRKIDDSQKTKFYLATKSSNDSLSIYYIGFVDNFDEDTYTLIVNDKEYPYKEWKKLLKR